MLKLARNAALIGLVIVAGGAAYLAVDYFEPTKQEAIQEAKDKNQIEAINILASERVAYYTKVLAIFTGALSGFGLLQIWFLRRSDETARIAANAAARSAKAAIGIELPIIRAASPELIYSSKPITKKSDYTGGSFISVPDKQTLIHRMNFHNAGRTPAFPTKIDFGWACVKSLPPKPSFNEIFQCKPQSLLKEQAETTIDTVFLVIKLTDADLAAVRNLAVSFWFYGRIYYVDFLGEVHSQGFCWRLECDQFKQWGFARSTETPSAYTSKEDS